MEFPHVAPITLRFSCRWPTTTRHLRELREARLVTVERRGRERLYRLDTQRLRSVTGDWLAWFDPSFSKSKRKAPNETSLGRS